jgi:hypothetical protein
MKSEVILDFCFVRKHIGWFKTDVELELKKLFEGGLHWYLDEKSEGDVEVIVAEVRGISRWQSEGEVLNHIEQKGSDSFWEWLQGYHLHVYPNTKGCVSCGCH